jgi:hypothetical protein
MPPNKSAYDVIQYEIQELGNDIRSNLSEGELKQIPAYQLQWLTSDEDYASEFGDVYEVNVNNETKIVAVDPNGGLLIFFEPENPSPMPPSVSVSTSICPKRSRMGASGCRLSAGP